MQITVALVAASCWLLLHLDSCPYNIYFQVLYQSDQFLDKNKDYVVPEHQDLLSASKCTFVAGLFPPLPEESAKSSKFSSIGSRFKVPLLCYCGEDGGGNYIKRKKCNINAEVF